MSGLNKLAGNIVAMDIDVKPESQGFLCTAYDKTSEVGVQLQKMPINLEEFETIENGVTCDWVFDISTSWVRRVTVGNYVVVDVETLGGDLKNIVERVKNNVFLFTGFAWLYIENTTIYNMSIEGVKRRVFVGTEFNLSDLLENTCLGACALNTEKVLISLVGEFVDVPVAYARCKPSMFLLDDIHRAFIQDHDYSGGDVIVVKAGAGSGKTTTQLRLASRFSKKRILYLAFNKSLVQEIEGKLSGRGITNMTTLTFDALLRRVYIRVKGHVPEITDLKPQTIGGFVPWLNGKSRKLKSYYCKQFSRFCSDVQYGDMTSFCKGTLGKESKILEELWEKVLTGKMITFDSIRKLSFIGHWFKMYIDKEYDMIFVDEIQDFDMAMLRMLLDDTTLPKLFVGDPRQSIYEWRGCINAFDYMPKRALTVEFYSTFRIGEPALADICRRFKDCYMISKAPQETRFGTITDDDKYVYLFRSWRQLLTTARETTSMWIYGFEQKIIQMRNLHEKLQGVKDVEDMEFEDDLPSFLLSMSSEELNELICDIARNIVSKESSRIKFYTIHSYKGMEDDIIRVADDFIAKDEPNLYYVALTRGMKKICMDEKNSTKLDGKDSILDLLMSIVPTKVSATKVAVTKVANLEKEKPVSRLKLWGNEEVLRLMDLVKAGRTYEDISLELDRSVLAVELRLRKVGADMILEGKSIDEVAALTKVDRLSLEEAVDQERIKLAATNKGVKWGEKEVNKMLGLIKTGTNINQIAIICGRSVGSIKEKLFDQAGKFGILGFSIDDIMRTTGLSPVEVNTAIVAAKRKADL